MKRKYYVLDLAGGTATTSVQIQTTGTIKFVTVSILNAAAGKLEMSTSATTQIGTAAPTGDVVFRLTQSATAGPAQMINVPVNLKVSEFQTIYFHSTGAGNLGSVSFQL